jgi:hypothetical protein
MLASFIRAETKAGDPIVVGDTTVTPMARSFTLRLPGRAGGLVWNRPLAVVVQSGNGDKRTLPVLDTTRQAQLRLFGACLILALLTVLVQRQCRRTPCCVGRPWSCDSEEVTT